MSALLVLTTSSTKNDWVPLAGDELTQASPRNIRQSNSANSNVWYWFWGNDRLACDTEAISVLRGHPTPVLNDEDNQFCLSGNMHPLQALSKISLIWGPQDSEGCLRILIPLHIGYPRPHFSTF